MGSQIPPIPYRLPTLPVVVVCLLLFLGGSVPAPSQEVESRWPPMIEKVDQMMLEGKWKRGAKAAARTARQLIRDSWGPRESGGWLAELAFYRAVAEANLGNRGEAVWYWHVAQNLDPKIRTRDLSPYGSAAKVLLEYPLRPKGKAPPGVKVERPRPGGRFQMPEVPPVPKSVVQGNPRFERERTAASDVEMLIDEDGVFSHPIVLTPSISHPFLTYAVLEFLHETSPLPPARLDGKPVAVVVPIDIPLDYSRWGNRADGR
ncbi:MAG: hypothetical protein AAGD06_05035 [Acidobacteriota bacterium]